VGRALALLAPLAAERGSAIETELAEAPLIVGAPDEILALARNLIENALRHTPPGTRVRVQVGGGTAGVELVIDDAGPGITPAERERAFDRFWRRSGEDSPGSGLGLAIARGIAQRHGASLSLLDSPLGGLRVRVGFPAAAD
jgi:two-component system OmpR family sensor kinase/two-component system sensor histidine kinase QseC